MLFRKDTDKPTRALYEAGISPMKFIEEHLGVTYQGFRYRCRHGRLRLEDYHKILHYTGKTFEEIWPNPYSTTPQPIKLNLTPNTPVSRPIPQPKKEIQPQEPVQPLAPAPSFKIEDVYAGGLPPEDSNAF